MNIRRNQLADRLKRPALPIFISDWNSPDRLLAATAPLGKQIGSSRSLYDRQFQSIYHLDWRNPTAVFDQRDH